MKSKPFFITFVVGATSLHTHADVLASWDVSGLDVAADLSAANNYALESTPSPAGVSGATLSLSGAAQLEPSTSNNQYGFKIRAGAGSPSRPDSLESALAAGHFMEFDVEASPGFELNLTSLDFLGRASSTGSDGVALFSNIAGFSSGSELDSVTGIQNVTGGFDTDASGFDGPGGVIDLTGGSYQGITSATFRIYGWGSTSNAGVTNFRNLSGDDLVINGTVAAVTPVPEISTALPLACLLGFSLVGRRRKASKVV